MSESSIAVLRKHSFSSTYHPSISLAHITLFVVSGDDGSFAAAG